MRNRLLLSGLLAVWFLVPSPGRAQNGNDGAKLPKATVENTRLAAPEDYAQLLHFKEITGHLMSMQGNLVTIRVEFQKLEPKDNYNPNQGNKQANAQMRQQQQLMRLYQQALTARTPAQQAQRMQQLYNTMQLQQMGFGINPQASLANSPFKAVTVAVDFELPLKDEVRVTKATLGLEYDDKGSVVQYTAEQLKKLRDPVQPGYGAKMEDVQVAMLVKLFLTKSKAQEDAAKAKADKAKADKEKAKEGDTDAKPAEKDAKPAEKDAKLAEKDAKPAEKDAKLVNDAAKAADVGAKPADKAVKPADIAKLGGALNMNDMVLAADRHAQVRGILILSDPDPNYLPKETPAGKKKKKKKNNN